MSRPATPTRPPGAPPAAGFLAKRSAPPAPGRRGLARERGGGAAISALLHVAVFALLTFGLPEMSRAKPEAAKEIPVEVVKAPEPEKTPAEPPKEEPPKAEPAPPKAEAPKGEPPKAEAPKPEPPVAEAPKPAPPEPPPAPAPPPAAEAPPPEPPNQEAAGGRKVHPDEIAPPDAKAALGVWILRPLTIDVDRACGAQRVSGQIVLDEQAGANAYYGTMRVHYQSRRCGLSAEEFRVGLLIQGSVVVLVGRNFQDTGTIDGDTITLNDRFGPSLWKRQAPPAAKKK